MPINPVALRQLLAQQNGSVSTYNPQAQMRSFVSAQQKQQAAAQRRAQAQNGSAFDQWSAQMDERAEQAQQGQGGGGFSLGGALGAVADSPFGKVVGAGMKAIDVPRRAMLLGVENAKESLSGNPNREGIGMSGLKDRLWDDEYSFGSVMGVDTGNKWADMAIGLGGDIALDPMTYVTLGAGRFAGQAGREAAAVTARRGGLDSPEILQRIGRGGVNALGPQERAAFNEALQAAGSQGIGQAGLRFAGQRIPGTGGLAQGVGRGLAGARAGIMDTRAGQTLRTLRADSAVGDARLAFAGGRSAERASVGFDTALDVLAGDPLERAGKSFSHRWTQEGRNRYKDLDDAASSATVHNIEAGRAANVFTEIAEDAQQFGVGDVARMGPQYTPNRFTPDATAWMGEEAGGGARVLIDDVSESGVLKPRTIKDGETVVIKGQPVKITSNTKLGIQADVEAVHGPLGFKLFEDDIRKLVPFYADSLGRDVGNARRLGTIGSSAASQSDAVADTAGMAANKASLVADAQKVSKAAGRSVDKNLEDLVRRLDSASRRTQHGLTNKLLDAGRSAEAAGSLTDDAVRQARSTATLSRNADAAANRSAPVAGVARQDAAAASTDVNALTDLLADGKAFARTSTEARVPMANSTFMDGGAGPKQGDMRAWRASRRDDLRRSETFQKRHKKLMAEADVASSNAVAAEATARTAKQTEELGEQAVKELRAQLRTVGKVAPQNEKALKQRLAELEGILDAHKGDPSLRIAADLLSSAELASTKLDAAHSAARAADEVLSFLRKAKPADLRVMVKMELRSGWDRVGEKYMAKDTVLRSETAAALKRFETIIDDDESFKLLADYTAFFKTYATLSPGFHVRNAMGAVFMNFTEGVSVNTHRRALAMWAKLQKDPVAFYNQADTATKNAIDAVYASGAGGSVEATELFGKRTTKVIDNAVTRRSRKLGEWVEGPARLALALDSAAKGHGLEESIARIARIQFDYSQASKFDRTMKKYIPFWTFMSRNLPLQLTQIALKPRLYNQYQSFVRNVRSEEGDELVPLWWAERGAFELPLGDNLFGMPDLAHIALGEDLAKLDPRNPLRLASNLNPALRVPTELATDKKFFSDSPFREDENKWLYALTNMAPTAGQANRLTDGGAGVDLQALANWLGVPIRKLTPELEQREKRRRQWADD